MTKRTTSQSNRRLVASTATDRKQRTTYVVFGIIIVALIFLIGWFLYVLIVPEKPTTSEDVSNQNNVNSVNTNTTKKKNKNKNSNVNTSNANADGLVEPDANENVNENANADVSANKNENDNTNSSDEDSNDETTAEDENKTTVTLYFPKSGSSCGEVYPVERDVELSEDVYGDTILTMMAGPTDEESDYADGVPSTVRLRQVQYTADGPLVTVDEGYDALDSCTQQTVDAAFIKTSNAMFDLPTDGTGIVEVGEVETEDAEAEADDTDSADDESSNTNSTN